MTSNVCPFCLCLSQAWQGQTATLTQTSQVLDCMLGLDSLLFLIEFPRYSYPPLCFSQSLSWTPPFSITWSDLLFAVAPLSPCPRHLSLWVQACQYSPSFVQLFTSPTHYFPQVFEHTHQYNHTHTHVCTFSWSHFPIHPPTSFVALETKLPIKGQHHLCPESRSYLIGFQQPAHTYNRTHAACAARWMEWL